MPPRLRVRLKRPMRHKGRFRGIGAAFRPWENSDRKHVTLLLTNVKREVSHYGSYSQQQESGHHPEGGAGVPAPQTGRRFRFFFQPDGAVVILPRIPTSALKGSLPKRSRAVSVDEMDAAIEAGATKRFR
jgi:hypothetical protein